MSHFFQFHQNPLFGCECLSCVVASVFVDCVFKISPSLIYLTLLPSNLFNFLRYGFGFCGECVLEIAHWPLYFSNIAYTGRGWSMKTWKLLLKTKIGCPLSSLGSNFQSYIFGKLFHCQGVLNISLSPFYFPNIAFHRDVHCPALELLYSIFLSNYFTSKISLSPFYFPNIAHRAHYQLGEGGQTKQGEFFLKPKKVFFQPRNCLFVEYV